MRLLFVAAAVVAVACAGMREDVALKCINAVSGLDNGYSMGDRDAATKAALDPVWMSAVTTVLGLPRTTFSNSIERYAAVGKCIQQTKTALLALNAPQAPSVPCDDDADCVGVACTLCVFRGAPCRIFGAGGRSYNGSCGAGPAPQKYVWDE
jgi:hypothetical protein